MTSNNHPQLDLFDIDDPTTDAAGIDGRPPAGSSRARRRTRTARITSQPIKRHGGKFYQADRIHALAPQSVLDDPIDGYTHRIIVFAGGLGEFWNWHPIEGISETVNDIDRDVINFFAVLRDRELFAEFERLVWLTPFSDTEFKRAKAALQLDSAGPQPSVRRAVDFFAACRLSRQALGRDYATPTTRVRRGMNEQVSAYLSAVDGLPACVDRLRRVEIRNLDFRTLIPKYDHPRALLHCDPPYLHATRNSVGEYGAHEMSLADHQDLLQILADVQGRFMLHGYHSDLYDSWAADHGLRCDEQVIDNKASGSRCKQKCIECIWMKY